MIMPRPDSRLADAAEHLLRESSPPVLVEHCLRTYAFGAALLEEARRPVDHEVLFVASALHDVGLTELEDDGTTPFEQRGARLARDAVVRSGAGAVAADLVHDAVALHLELGTADDPRAEVAGVHLGAAVDVLGLRLDQLPPGLLDRVLERHPRHDFAAHMVAAMTREAAANPASRTAALVREFGLLELIAAAPVGR
jgi:hypothetical protein